MNKKTKENKIIKQIEEWLVWTIKSKATAQVHFIARNICFNALNCLKHITVTSHAKTQSKSWIDIG